MLVQSGVNVDATNTENSTGLHVAARRGATDCVDVLLAAGATPNLIEENGRTPFGVAVFWRRRRIWPLFLRAGAEIPVVFHNTDQYITQVQNAGGFKKYEQAHLVRLTNTFEPKLPLLPPELVRHVVSFWLHAGYY